MADNVYEFRKGFAIRNVDAQTVGDELYRIRAAHNSELLAEHVVEWAVNPESPIHECFTWDGERAAHLYRLVEARTLIKSVVVIGPKKKTPKPAYFNVTVERPAVDGLGTETKRFYELTTEMVYDSPEFHSALNSALKDLTSALMTVQQLWDLAPRSKKLTFTRVKDLIRNAREIMTAIVPARALD